MWPQDPTPADLCPNAATRDAPGGKTQEAVPARLAVITGAAPRARCGKTCAELQQQVLPDNLTGTVLCGQAALPDLVAAARAGASVGARRQDPRSTSG
jgi:hypothetical protein